MAERRVFAQQATQPEPGHVGQHQLGDEQIRLLALREGERFVPFAHRDHLVRGARERVGETRAPRGVAVCDEDAPGSSHGGPIQAQRRDAPVKESGSLGGELVTHCLFHEASKECDSAISHGARSCVQ